jgi:hypothetical protein
MEAHIKFHVIIILWTKDKKFQYSSKQTSQHMPSRRREKLIWCDIPQNLVVNFDILKQKNVLQ